MGYKIWRKDRKSWCLAFDDVFVTKELVDSRIAELNAIHHELVRLGELSFYPYRDDIKLSRDGEIIDNTAKARTVFHHKRKRSKKSKLEK